MRREHQPNTDLRELLAVVDSLPCSISRSVMRRALRGLRGRSLYIASRYVVAPEQLSLCLSLLGTMPISEVRTALMVRLGVGKSKAYRLITAGLQARRDLRVAEQAAA